MAAIVTLVACSTQAAQDTIPSNMATAAASTTVVEDSVGPTTGAAESVESTVGAPEPTNSTLPDLSLPGTNLNEPAGEYGWTGSPGSRGWMHRVVEMAFDEFRQTQIAFTVKNDCFEAGGDPVAMTVAGLDGLYVEPYHGGNGYWNTKSGEGTTGAYALPVGDRTLCVYLRWDAATTEEELAAARQIIESIVGQPYAETGIRINFTLPFGWDTG